MYKIKENKDVGPTIMTNFLRNKKTGELNGLIRTQPLMPGMIIERAGRKYIVDKNGTQRRVKE